MQSSIRFTDKRFQIILLLLILAVSAFAKAETECDPAVSRLVSARGQVEAFLAQTGDWRPAAQDQHYCGDDKVRTGSLSRALLAIEQGMATFLALDQQTLLNFVKNSGRIMLSVERGQVHVRSHTPSRFDVTTPFVNAGIEGTEFLVTTSATGAEITVFEGKVRAFNAQGEILITKGQTALGSAGTAPVLKQTKLTPDDAVRWALYYPPLIDFAAPGALASDPQVQQAAAFYARGDILAAINSLSEPTDQVASAKYAALQAGLLLTVGRVDEAEVLINQSQLDQTNGPTFNAMRAIIALTRNDRDRARQLAQAAIDADASAPVGFVALSYVEQASSQLEASLQAIERALTLSQNALLYCRKAELLASLGNLALAKEAAEMAWKLNPNLGRSQALLGFTQLLGDNLDAAEQSFHQAIQSDASDPLAHFGQGLIKIRRNDMPGGIEKLEIAASLDPNNSSIRSYLGKAYYEQNRHSLSQLQFDLAKAFDPKDPTPYFYNAIQKHATNRPIEALEDMEKAIELNDNRSVYRSRQMLDSDLAARESAIGRIYNEIGFGPRALVQAWSALAEDPGDYSAHRLLSDSYSSLPRSDMARTSELLQSQLLQPLNTTPVQPQLAESSQFLLGNLGPSARSLNEFNPLFERNRSSNLASAQVGSNNTYSDEVVHSGLWNDWSYSLGQFHYQTDGTRTNNGIDANIYNVFLQKRVNQELSVQGEYRRKELEYGDLGSSFFPIDKPQQNALNNRQSLSDNDTFRLGFNWAPTLDSKIIGSYIKAENNFSTVYSPFILPVSSGELRVPGSKTDSHLIKDVLELQYQLNSGIFKAILGGRWGNTDFQDSSSSAKNNNGYAYGFIDYPKYLKWTIGATITSINDGQISNEYFSPKIGLVWSITRKSIFRAAAFKSITDPLIYQSSIEPTQVAGFNQIFPDYANWQATRYGIGFDQKLFETLSFGVEASRRNLASLDAFLITHWHENQYRAYLLWAFNSKYSLKFDYIMESFRNDNLEYGPINTDTMLFPISLNYYSPNGWFLGIKSTYYRQNVQDDSRQGVDDAVFFDAGAGFRLPNRRGLIELQVLNLLNQRYQYEDSFQRGATEKNNGMPTNQPFPNQLTMFVRCTFAF